LVLCGLILIFDFLHSPTFMLLIDLELFCFWPWEGEIGWCRSIMQVRNSKGTSEAKWIKALECSWGGVILERTSRKTSCFTYQCQKNYEEGFLGTWNWWSTNLVVIVITQSRAIEACIMWDQCQQKIQLWINSSKYHVFVWVV
jgi:hypothetical protein